jgi:ABC-type transport system involved in multi-copper enzyme maturation permease subunit
MLREKRLAAFAIVYAGLSGLITYFLLSDAQRSAAAPPNALGIALPLFFLDTLALVLLAGTFVLDAVGKERDAGMLGLLLTTPASSGALLAAKAVAGMLAYALAMILGMASALIVGLSLGPVVPQAVLLGFVGPLLVLYVFMLGSGLLLSVVAPSARLAIALGMGLYLPLFLMGATPLFAQLFQAAPVVGNAIAWTPFAAASEGINAIIGGGATPWSHYIATLAVGAAALALAFVAFARQEGAKS